MNIIFAEENVAQPHLKDISISSGKMHSSSKELGRVRSLRRIHVRNLHFPCLATHYGAEIDRRVRIPSTAYERVARKWNDDVSRKDPPSLSPRCRPPPFVYHSVDRSSSTSLAGNTNRVAKITLMSQAHRERERKLTRKREREMRAAGVASSLINDVDSTFAVGGVSDYARCNQPLYYITG